MKHYNVVAAVVCHDGKYLCMQKGKTKFEYTSYKWEFPTPKAEADGFKRREHADSKWCSKEELKRLDWAAADVGVVEVL